MVARSSRGPTMKFTAEMLAPVTAAGAKAKANVASLVLSVNLYGGKLGLDQPHRFAQFVAQLSHESMGFIHDAEIWGPTPAQQRYEDRKDLGHSNKVANEAHTYRGRTTIQITGRANYIAFRDWVRTHIDPNCPDFEANPDAVNTDPWEGLAPIWYWDSRNLNKYADTGNNEMITRVINGGLNGYGDRLERYSIIGMSILGFKYTAADRLKVQTKGQELGVYDGDLDGVDGPKTRAAIHQMLVLMGSTPVTQTKAAPVTEVVPVAPKSADRVSMGRVP